MGYYEKVGNLIDLALELQNSYTGLSINDISEMYSVSRRTAIRMKSIIDELFSLEEVKNYTSKEKKWRLTKSAVSKMVCFTEDEIAELKRCKAFAKNINVGSSTNLIDNIISKIYVLNSQKTKKTDVEAMLEVEGYARRQFPRRKISDETLEIVSTSIKAYKCIEFEYTNKKEETKIRKVQPYGIIYGENTLLLAYEEAVNDFRNFTFHKIKNAKILDEYFEKDENFKLEDYLSRSFGVYQEIPMDIKLLFSKTVADDILNYHLHSTQEMTKNEDGTVTVTMHTGGRNEICWHLFKWGENVKILEPQCLIDTYNDLLQKAITVNNEALNNKK